MPIIMSKAFSTKLQKIILANEYDHNSDDVLLCEDPECRTVVTHVNEYEKQYGDTKIVIPAFFRLKSKYFKHSEKCKYNINNNVKIIARNSNSAIVESIDKKHYKFRINLVYSEMIKHGINENSSGKTNSTPDKNNRTVKYVHDGTLTPYISTMKKVIELRTKLEENKDLENIIILEIRNYHSKQVKEIKWDNFYYTVYNYDKLYHYLASGKCHHIICIEGTIMEFKEPTNNFSEYYIRIKSPSIKKTDSNIIKVPSIQLLIKNEIIYKYIKENYIPNTRIAVFSIFKIPGNKFNNQKQIEYLNISGTIYTASQFIFFK